MSPQSNHVRGELTVFNRAAAVSRWMIVAALLVAGVVMGDDEAPNRTPAIASQGDRNHSNPFDGGNVVVPANAVDQAVLGDLKKRGITPANICSDATFVRRVYLDVIGTIPTVEEVSRVSRRPSLQ